MRQSDRTSCPYPKISARAETACHLECYSPQFGQCSSSFSSLFTILKPMLRNKALPRTLPTLSFYTASALLQDRYSALGAPTADSWLEIHENSFRKNIREDLKSLAVFFYTYRYTEKLRNPGEVSHFQVYASAALTGN